MLDTPRYWKLFGVVPWVVFAAIFCGEVSSRADVLPQPPCGGETFPPYPDLENSPAATVWDRTELGRDWTPPACTEWTDPGFKALVVTVARFRASGVEDLLGRIGAISKHAGIRYWSTTRKRWQTLIVDAHALSEASGDRTRQDFLPEEMTEASNLYFQEEDNLAGKAIYRMRIRTVSPDRLVFGTENISDVRYHGIPIFRSGDLQSVTFLDRESRDVWRYYSILRTGKNASLLTVGHAASSVNRAVAYYRYLAGIPTDKEPPPLP